MQGETVKFDITIYLPVHITSLSNMVAHFQFPSMEFWCYCLDVRSVTTVLLLVTLRTSEEFGS